MSRPGGVIAGRPPWRLGGALASGLLLVLAFPPADLGWLAWVALAPLLLSLQDATPGQAFRLGTAAGVVACGGLMLWLRLFGTLAWAFVSLGMAAFLGAFAALVAWLAPHYGRPRSGAWVWIAPVCWVGIEVVRSLGPLGFPWGLLGLTQYRAPMVLPLASVGGVFGVGAVIALVNAVVAAVIASRRLTRAAALGAAVALGLIAVSAALPPSAGGASRIVAAVQPNVAPVVRGDPATATALLDGLLQQTMAARAAGAELIVYPETAVPPALSPQPATRSAIARAAGGAIVVVGASLPGPYNGAVVIGPSGETLGRYAKRRLVPFGEAGVKAGSEPGVVVTPAGTVGLAICYESAFTDLIRPLVASGADVLALLTNDGWFGASAGPAQHAAHAVVRAVETGRSVVRAANTGTSMLIRPDGTVVAAQPLGSGGVLTASLPVGGPRTPYVRWGWLVAPLAVAAVLVAGSPLAWSVVRARPAAAVRLGLAVGVPGTVVAVARAFGSRFDEPGVVASALVLVACVALARGTLFLWRRALLSAVVSAAVVALLLLAMRLAYARYGFEVPLGPADGHWQAWVGRSVLAGLAVEAWLRGAVFGAALALGGWPLALCLPTLLGVALHAGQPQEPIFWQLFTGVGFGVIRLWTRDAVGLGPARGIGDAVVAGLSSLR